MSQFPYQTNVLRFRKLHQQAPQPLAGCFLSELEGSGRTAHVVPVQTGNFTYHTIAFLTQPGTISKVIDLQSNISFEQYYHVIDANPLFIDIVFLMSSRAVDLEGGFVVRALVREGPGVGDAEHEHETAEL